MYSSSMRGRSVLSTASSCGLAGAAAISLSVSIIANDSSCLRQHLQRMPDSIGNGDALGQLLDCVRCFLVAVSERHQRVEHVCGHRRRAMHADGRGDVRSELVLQLEQKTL